MSAGHSARRQGGDSRSGRWRERGRRCGRWRWRLLEAAAEREVEIHALHALLGLHADERGLGGAQRELALLDEPEIGASHLEAGLHDAERLLIVGERLYEDPLAVARGYLRCQCAFDLSEGAQSDRGVLGDRLFLLGRPDLDLRLEGAAA